MQVLPISHVPSLSWQPERREWMPGVKIKGKHQIVGRILGQNREVYLGTWLVHFKSVSHTHICQERLAKSTEVFAAIIFFYANQEVMICLIRNRHCLQPAWIMDIVYFNIWYIVDMAGIFFQYIAMKKYFNDSPMTYTYTLKLIYLALSGWCEQQQITIFSWCSWCFSHHVMPSYFWAKRILWDITVTRDKALPIYTIWSFRFARRTNLGRLNWHFESCAHSQLCHPSVIPILQHAKDLTTVVVMTQCLMVYRRRSCPSCKSKTP